MTHEELTLTSRDGTRLNAVRWSPPGAAAGPCMVLVHGLAEHLGRYEQLAAALTDAGWRVLGVELRGHGDSEGKRGHVDRWEGYTDDLAAALARAAQESGGPIWLLGHSMGGLVVLDLLARGADGVAGAVLSNPLLGVAVEAPAWKTVMARLLSSLLPRLSLSNEVDPQHLSRDPAVVKAYVADPKVFTTVTPRWFTEMSGAIARVNAAAPGYDLPLLVLASGRDRLCNPEATQGFAAACPNAQLQHYPELFHELFNEPEKEQVMAAMIGWLEDHPSVPAEQEAAK